MTFLRKNNFNIYIVYAITLIIIFTLLSFNLFLLNKLKKRSLRINIPNISTIETVGVEVYWDADCKERINYIDWGLLIPGSLKEYNIYIKSISNTNVTVEIYFNDYYPNDISEYFHLKWDLNETSLYPGEILLTTLNLTVSNLDSFYTYILENKVTEMSFNIIIIVSGK